jgi:hypothetical protein
MATLELELESVTAVVASAWVSDSATARAGAA